ncbi:hypothetical protein FDECE_11815 [Fusarium decemcellulare]|nr:hypothetical protein FDECE_11815 [Fusarium decemcellulare]
MPQAVEVCKPALGIRLENQRAEYAPGDTIMGCVYRTSHTVSPSSSVSLRMSGRIQTRLSDTNHRAPFNLISPEHAQTIFEGPLHIAGDEHVWPFVMTIPQYVDPQHLDCNTKIDTNVPFDTRDHILPSTFKLDDFRRNEAFIEYFLQATLKISRKGNIETVSARLPFRVTNMSPKPPIVDFELKRSISSGSVSSYRLVPGMEDAKLSLSQKMKQSLSTASVPEFAFNLQVDAPRLLQLSNPDPVPFRLRAIPDWHRTSDSMRDVPQKIKLLSLSVQIATDTDIIFERSPSPYNLHESYEVDLRFMKAIRARGKEVFIPCADESTPIDVGRLSNLRLGPPGSVYPDTRLHGQFSLHSTFTTYNIRQSHRLLWKVCVEIAGEKFDVSGSQAVTLLTPSDERGPGPEPELNRGRHEDWIQPPEEEPPPSFEQVQKEDLAAMRHEYNGLDVNNN